MTSCNIKARGFGWASILGSLLSLATVSGGFTSRDLECYSERYADLKFMQGDLARLRKHWKQHGESEGRTMGCSKTVERGPSPHRRLRLTRPPPPPQHVITSDQSGGSPAPRRSSCSPRRSLGLLAQVP